MYKQKIKEWIVLAISFLSTIWLVYISYWTYQTMTTVSSWSILKSADWNILVGNIEDLKTKTDVITKSWSITWWCQFWTKWWTATNCTVWVFTCSVWNFPKSMNWCDSWWNCARSSPWRFAIWFCISE